MMMTSVKSAHYMDSQKNLLCRTSDLCISRWQGVSQVVQDMMSVSKIQVCNV